MLNGIVPKGGSQILENMICFCVNCFDKLIINYLNTSEMTMSDGGHSSTEERERESYRALMGGRKISHNSQKYFILDTTKKAFTFSSSQLKLSLTIPFLIIFKRSYLRLSNTKFSL